MATTNLDHADLAGAAFQGLVREDVDLSKVWDISNIPLPFTDRIGSDATHNAYAEWTEDTLQAVDITNASVDGADLATDQSEVGVRVGNQHQIPTKLVAVSHRARAAGTIAFADALAYQVMMRQRELRRDVEAIMLEPQASVADDGSAVAGLLAGLPSWLTTSTSRGATGADGGFDGSGIVDAPTAGNKRGLTETLVRDIAQSVWESGGNPSLLMGTPGVIRGLSVYMFTSSARIATLQRDEQGMGAATAIGSVNVFLTDFGVTLEMVPNRLQQTYTAADTGDVSNLFLIDPEHVRQGFLHPYRIEEQGRTGLSDKRQMVVDVTLKVLNEAAHGVIADIDDSIAVLT